ncbi:MAG: hypothetical protein EOP19_00190 [Hyphomicrobiales bacterium]|nr:MAG: hypothetical protein EOP19_00190 [Hyphomicrobiales bacterium]
MTNYPTHIKIPNQQLWNKYDSGTTLTKGPFPITFTFFSKADLRVSVDGVEFEQSGFSYTADQYIGGHMGGSLMLSEFVSNAEVLIWRHIAPVRTTDFSPASQIPIQSIDTAFDQAMAVVQDLRRDVDRSIKVAIGETPENIDYTDLVDSVAVYVTDDDLIASVQAGISAAGAEQVVLLGEAGEAQIALVEEAGSTAAGQVDAAGVAALALVENATRALLFNSTTSGLAVAGEGQEFTVVQANGLGLDWYRDVSGAAHFLQKISPGPGAETIIQQMVLERSPHVCPQYPWTPRVDVRWGDARLYDGAVAPDRSNIDLTPHRAINAFACGYVPNATGSQTSPAHTSLYIDGPAAGVKDGMNYTYTANQQLYIVRTSSLAVDIPDQVMTLVFDHKRQGGSDQTLQAGLSTALDATITAGSAWTNQYKRQLTWAGVSDIVIRAGASAADVNLARVFLWPGPSASVPAWDDMHFVGGRPAYAFSDALLMDGAAATTVAGGRSLIVYDPDYKTGGHTYAQPLFSHTFCLDGGWAGGAATIIGTDEDEGHGTDALGAVPGFQLFIETATGFEGLVSPELWSLGTRDLGSVDTRGGVITQVAQFEEPSTSFKALFVDGTMTLASTTNGATSAPLDVSLVRVMSANDVHTPEIILQTTPGESYATLVDDIPAGKTPDQISALLFAQTAKLKLDPTITKRVGYPLHLNIIGDSNDSGSGDWNTLVRAHDFLGDGYYPLPFSNHGSGGDGAQVNDGWNNQWLYGSDWLNETDNRCGGRAVVRSRLTTGRPVVTTLRGVTNDSVYLEANGAAALFNNYYLPFYETVLAEGELSWMLISSPLAHGSSKGAAYHTQRLLFADLQAAWASDYPNRVWFVDVTRDVVMGSAVEANNPASVHFTQPGGLHLQAAGALALANLYKPALQEIQSYAMSLGY